MDNSEVNQMKARLDKLEKQQFEEYITILEIMSNATFFGDLKRTTCKHAKQGQCSFFALRKEAKDKVPIVAKCRIDDCPVQVEHYHIDVSNLTCALCAIWQKGAQQLNSKLLIPHMQKLKEWQIS